MRFWLKKFRETRALKALFLLPDGSLKPEAKTVLAWLKEEVNAKGRRMDESGSALYSNGNFDAAKVVYWAGQRRVLDLIMSRLNVDDDLLFKVVADEDAAEAEMKHDLETI